MTKSIRHTAPLILFLLSSTFVVHAQTYSGQAAVAKASVRTLGQPGLTTGLADTGDLPSTGGNISNSTQSVAVPSVLGIPSSLSVGNSTASTSGSVGSSISSSSVAGPTIQLFAGGIQISASVVSSNTGAVCSSGSEVLSSGGAVTSLFIDGIEVTVLPGVNQSVALSGLSGTVTGTLMINEEITGPRFITRNALHATVTGPGGTTIEVVVASSSSGINCGLSPFTNLYGGRGTGLRVRQGGVTDVTTILADTGVLPRSGGFIDDSTLPINLGVGILDAMTLSTGNVESASSGGVSPSTPTSTDSSSAVQNLAVDLLAGTVLITATTLTSETRCQCSLGTPSCTEDSTILGLNVVIDLPLAPPVVVPITIDGTPNQVVDLSPMLGGLGTVRLTLNGRQSAGSGDTTAFPLRIEASLVGLTTTDILTARSHSDMTCALAPSSAPVSLRGRVMDRGGRGLSRAQVTIWDGNGYSQTAITSSFGHYAFKGVPAGRVYFVSVSARGYTFSPQSIALDDSLSGFDLYADGGRMEKAVLAGSSKR